MIIGQKNPHPELQRPPSLYIIYRDAPGAGPVALRTHPGSELECRLGMADERALAEREPWRESVLRGMLNVAAVIAPLICGLAMFIRPSPRSRLDYVVLASCAS